MINISETKIFREEKIIVNKIIVEHIGEHCESTTDMEHLLKSQ